MKLQLILIALITIYFSNNIKSQNHLDYSLKSNWVNTDENTKEVDVFYVYPTVFFSKTPQNMDISNKELREEAIGVYKEQCSIFNNSCNIYAPFYEQMSIAVLSLEGDEYNKYFIHAYEQVKASFLYYMKHHNNGKPFFLAGHSQGSLMLLELMKDIFNEDELQKQLIAAYTIGYSLTTEDINSHPWLKVAKKENDLGVIITYNTQSPNATGSPVLMPTAHCVNPLSWTQKTTLASKELNKGAVFFNEKEELDKEILQYTDAQVREDGALIVSTPNPDDFYTEGKSFFPKGVYHKYDYQFFYRNLEENVEKRKEAYLYRNKK
jgi:hypothetical protein